MEITRISLRDQYVDCSFPSTWDELTPEQLLYISKYWESWQELSAVGESLFKAKAMLLLEISGLRTKAEKIKMCDILSFVDEGVDIDIFKLTDFIFDRNIKLTKNLLPKVKVGYFTWYFGPADRLGDLTIEEFAFAFSAYINYSNTKAENSLNNLFAILYRPGNETYQKDGKRKVAFKYELIEERARRISNVKFEYKYALFLFFCGCMEYFGSHKKYGPIFRKASKEERAGNGNFIETTRMMSGGKFGAFDQTKETNLHIFLQELAELIEKNKK